MKKVFLALWILIFGLNGYAQLNNSWIDYNKTYYKFFVGENKLHRISKATLSSVGLGETNADHFQLWRNGKQVPLFTTETGSALSSGGYLEFIGEANDFEPDRKLFNPGAVLISEKYSLITDTAAYFLTVNPSGGNLRFRNVANTAPSTLAPTPYFMREFLYHNKAILSNGNGEYLGQYIFSSSFDSGEGWMTESFLPNTDYGYNLPLYPYKDGPQNNVEITYTVEGFAYFNRVFQFKVNGNLLDTTHVSGVRARKKELKNLPVSLLNATNQFSLQGTGDINDRAGYGYFLVKYPSLFYFSNSSLANFTLPASTSAQNIEITGFNYGSSRPVLYDLTGRIRIEGEIASSPGTVKFVLPALASPSNFVLISQDPTAVKSVSALTTKNFVDFNKVENQGDYLIITDPKLNLDNKGVNVTEEYRAFRKSADGGSFNAAVYDINELTDQFGFGINMHPSGIQDFIFFADRDFKIKPKFVLLIGRGLEYNYRIANRNSPERLKQDFIPTFGMPASDILLATVPGKSMPIVPIGRIASVTGEETRNYLDKLKQYVANQKLSSPRIADKLWMKNFMHVIGGANVAENDLFLSMARQYEVIARDTLAGANVETFTKTSSGTVQQANSERISELFKNGLSFMQYFGHASATVLEFDLTDLSIFDFNGKYPVVNISGCDAGNSFRFYQARATNFSSITENYVLTPSKGSVGFLASTHFGIPSVLHAYNLQLYNQICRENYGGYLGDQIQKVTQNLGGNEFSTEFRKKLQNEQTNLHGDPAIKINYAEKPDYAIEEQYISLNPANITTSDNNFQLKVLLFNLGKAINDSILVSIKRKLPNQTTETLFNQKIKAILFSDSIVLKIPVSLSAKGNNQLTVTVDDGNKVDELYESNNTVTKSFFITEIAINPVYPNKYAIVKTPPATLYASSSNFGLREQKYLLQLDTTALFNSPLVKSFNKTGPAGLVEFPMGSTSFLSNTVYYWRVATAGADTIWNSSSFIYIPGEKEGFNQSHYYQFKENNYDTVYLDTDRQLKFVGRMGDLKYYVNRSIGVLFNSLLQIGGSGTAVNTIQFNVLDITGVPLKNDYSNGQTGLYGSNYIDPRYYMNQFEFNITTPAERKRVLDFINLLPKNATIAIYPHQNSILLSDWVTDRTIYGRDNLYDFLKDHGIQNIDSMNAPTKPFLFVFRKDGSMQPFSLIGNVTDVLEGNLPITYLASSGSVETGMIGPALSWDTFLWQGRTADGLSGDDFTYQLIGVKPDFREVPLKLIDSTSKNVDISSINALEYPYLKIHFNTSDPVNGTPYQPVYWRMYYKPVPEGAIFINPGNIIKDSLVAGDSLHLDIGFKNISNSSFEKPVKVKLTVVDKENITKDIIINPGKALQPGDTMVVSKTIDPRDLPDLNNLQLEFNPDNDQPEQFHFNNVFVKGFSVRSDAFNPLLDVTFDGVHILNKDLVSATPNILITLTDENRALALADTSLFIIQLRSPDNNLKRIHFGSEMQFIAADISQGTNKAQIELKPRLLMDGEYELIVSAKDASGNNAGKEAYRVSFTVMNKPMISNLLNYPNPFTTSTAFVFTLTGSEIPQNIRIQILTITGKIVREITQSELGPIHIGRNITEFKWDGTDMYGQKLGNGVYLYRVLTNLNGKTLDKFTQAGDQTDQYFKKGYGKMYLMR